jgi:CHAT domain-containing protein/tetratricopeptide (TPR) repeat protein
MGNLAAARPYLEQALGIRRRVLGDDHADTAASFNDLGNLLRVMGSLAAARPYFEQALEIHRRVFGDIHPNTATSLNNLGVLQDDMGDLAAGRSYHEGALAIRRRVLGNDHPDTAISLGNLGFVLQTMGDLVAARPYFEQALEIHRRVFGDDHPDTATSLNNLGGLLQDMGDLAAARPYFEQGLEIRRRMLGSEHPNTAESLNNLGRLLDAMGDLEGARPYYEQALAIHRRVLDNDHPYTAISLNNLGVLEVASGRIADAIALMRQASAINDRMIGQIFSIGSDRQRLAFLRSVQGNLECFLSLVHRHLADSPEAIRVALELVLRRKALTAEALAAQRDAILGGRYPQLRDTLTQLIQLRQRIAQKTLAGPAPGETPDAHQRQLAVWRAEGERLETELARQVPEMNLERQLRTADRRAVALALPEGVALIEFVRFDVYNFQAVEARGERRWQPARYLAFILPAGQPEQVQMIDLGEAEPIDQLIADFRNWIISGPASDRGVVPFADPAAPPPKGTDPPQGTDLRRKIFDPLVQALGKQTRLLLCPDGGLTWLPFEVLPAGTNGDRLLDRYQISYLATGRDVLRFGAAPTGTPAAPLIAADPDFDLDSQHAAPESPSPPAPAAGAGRGRCSRDLDRGCRAERLPHTRIEGQKVATLLGVEPWLDRTVLDAKLKAVPSPHLLHLATHGFFLPDQPHDPNQDRRDLGAVGSTDRLAGANWENPLLRSGLLLAGFNTWRSGGTPPAGAEDGMLTAEDVTGLDLLDTELVVLSACDTGLGAIHAGEGVFGLRRSFIVAGAKTLVMSLWKVPDQHTQELMVDFYERILKGEPRAEALRQARLAMRKKYPHPLYWGAFICQGDPGPLRTTWPGKEPA